jgi:chemosensory pili system protein ChpA (sensor histidine kinase/response regulator)
VDGAKVLVVDDDTIIRELVKLHLANNGYDVRVAADAVEAGHLILREVPGLIILDVAMPYMDGYEFATALKHDPATQHIPIVFLTAEDSIEEHAGRIGAAAYLKKPVTANRLLEVVRQHAEN